VPPLAQAARNRVSVLVEVAGDPPVLVTQIRTVRHRAVAPGACLGGAMNVISKADAPLTWVQPLRQGGISIGQEGDRCGARQRRTDAANRHSPRDRTTCECETTATPRRRDWCATR
jgi:hypothetical protein